MDNPGESDKQHGTGPAPAIRIQAWFSGAFPFLLVLKEEL